MVARHREKGLELPIPPASIHFLPKEREGNSRSSNPQVPTLSILLETHIIAAPDVAHHRTLYRFQLRPVVARDWSKTTGIVLTISPFFENKVVVVKDVTTGCSTNSLLGRHGLFGRIGDPDR